MTSSRTRRTPEQKRAEMEALHAQLTESVEALRSSENWAAYLRFCASFHRYSFSNLLLILAQCPEATQVAGYRAWQAKGRQVRKGETGIRILSTGTVKTSANDDDESTDAAETVDGRRRVFFPVSVFDISQTDVIEGCEDTSSPVRCLTGDDEHGILSRVVDYLTARGATVEFQHLGRGAQRIHRSRRRAGRRTNPRRHRGRQLPRSAGQDGHPRGRSHRARSPAR